MTLNQVDFLRRRTIRGLAAIPVLGVEGCTWLRQWLRRGPQLTDQTKLPAVAPILAPGPIARHPRKPAYAVDVHAHFFNASDINAQDYLVHSFGHSQSDDEQKFLEAIAGVIQAIADTAPSADMEYRMLVSVAQTPGVGQAQKSAQLQQKHEQHRSGVITNLAAEINRKNVHTNYFNIKRKVMRSLSLAAPQAAPSGAAPEITEQTIRDALTHSSPNQLIRRYRSAAEAAPRAKR